MKKFLLTHFSVSYNPWPYFLIFTLVDFLLNKFSWSLTTDLSIFCVGLVFPLLFFIAITTAEKSSQKPSFLSDFQPFGSRLVLWIFPALAILAYFWGLGSSAIWQWGDSIQPGVYALDLLHHWNWHLFETFGQTPSTGSYLCWAFLKITGLPLLSYQLPCALLMVLAAWVAYRAVWCYFPPTLSILFLGVFTLNQWSFVLSRTLILLPLWESIVIFCCVKFFRSILVPFQIIWACLLGLSLGLGPFAFPSWPVMIPLVFWLVFRKISNDRRFGLWISSSFLFSFLLALYPFCRAAQSEGYGSHIAEIGMWNCFSVLSQVQIIAGYLLGVFWTPTPQYDTWGGGFLNLFSTAFFFLGLMEIYRFRRSPLTLWVGAGFLLFLIPGFLSNTVEYNRILLILPLLALVSAIGIQALAFAFRPKSRIWILILLLSLSGGWDLYRFFRSGPESFPGEAINERRYCYEILEPLAAQKGPGLVFSEWIPFTNDYSLYYYTYNFNALLNPDLPVDKTLWAAIFTENHYLPLLLKQYPESKWTAIPTTKPGVNSRHIFGLIPITPSNRLHFLSWRETYDQLESINFQILDLPNGRNRNSILKTLLDFYPSVPDDPFLQSCFFEKLVFNYSWEKTFHSEDAWTQWTNFSGTFQKSFSESCQDVELCEKYGRLLAVENHRSEAKRIFEKALELSPENSWLKSEIQQLGLTD